MPARTDRGACRVGGFAWPPDESDFHDARITGRPSVIRLQCGWVDTVMRFGGRVVVLSLRTESPALKGRPTPARSTLEVFAATLVVPVRH
jgi:hypothetical protein